MGGLAMTGADLESPPSRGESRPQKPTRRRGRSRRGRSWLRPVSLPRAALAAVIVLLVAELGLRSIEEHLPRKTAGDTIEIELKYDQLRDLRAAGEPIDIVMLGNSTLDAGVDPTLFAESSRRFDAPFNGALLGAPLSAISRWATDFVLDESDPDTVVLGVTPLDVPTVGIFGISRPAVTEMFEASFDRLDPSTIQEVDREVSRRSALVSRRSAFRSPGELWRGITDTIADRDKQFPGLGPVTLEDGRRATRDRSTWENELIAPRGGIRTYWGGENDGTPPYRLSAGDRRTFETSTVDRLRLIGVIDAILDTGVDDVVVVIPPHDRALLADVGLPLRTFDRLADDLISVARDEGLAAVDMSRTEWGHDYFFDPAHLSKRGSSRFTQILAAELDRL